MLIHPPPPPGLARAGSRAALAQSIQSKPCFILFAALINEVVITFNKEEATQRMLALLAESCRG